MTQMSFPHERELKWVATDKIVQNDNNPRDAVEFTDDQLSLLRKSISQNGVWDPVVLTPYKGDTYRLLEGERRWTCARLEGMKEIPAQVVPRMNDAQELATMFQMHATWKGWKPAEELNAIEKLVEESPGKSDPELAEMLGMSVQRFKERKRLLELEPEYRAAIARGDLDPSAALKAVDMTKTLARQRPHVVEQLGGERRTQRALLDKAKSPATRKGITRDFDELRRDARDQDAVPDDMLSDYVSRPKMTLREARSGSKSLQARREVEDLIKRITAMNTDLRMFKASLESAPNLTALRKSLTNLIQTAMELEERIVRTTA